MPANRHAFSLVRKRPGEVVSGFTAPLACLSLRVGGRYSVRDGHGASGICSDVGNPPFSKRARLVDHAH
ncbi:hypothetical protein VZT92_022439 [Zoarces viviparus]|uniref:Uncharacterized protein n=1 Tax=Zoarces viviparus TaxID=48416 RepID=A0AAW1EBX2_ZOAVI